MADITRRGFHQKDLVTLLEKTVGSIFIPCGSFNETDANTDIDEIGGGQLLGILFDDTTEAHMDITLLAPENMDVTKAASIYVYWSSAQSTASRACVWNIDYVVAAAGEDVGATVSNIAAAADTDIETADDLNISEAMTLPADAFASTSELLFLSLHRLPTDGNDNLGADAACYGIRMDYTCLPSVSVTGPANITPLGIDQGNLVKLLEKSVGRIWIPVSEFNDMGNATLGNINSKRAFGMLFDPNADEHIDTAILLPKNYDVTKAASIHIYWSSADTNGTDCTWDIDFLAIAAGENIGASVSNMTAGVDKDNTSANYLNIGPAITIPANALASTDELLFLSLFRDIDASDDLAADASFFGLRIDYTTTPSISTTVPADITRTGMLEGDMVTLLDRTVGRLWIPMSRFMIKPANGAAVSAIQDTSPGVISGLSYATAADDSMGLTMKVPANYDITKESYIYVYWSTEDTGTSEVVNFDIDYLAIATGDDIGAGDSEIVAAADTNIAQADGLQITEAIIIPANKFASTDELFILSLRRDTTADDLSSDADVFGIRWDYTCDPSISSS